MDILEVVGLNIKYYRYQKKWTQEVLADKSEFKISYISLIERYQANMTLRNLDYIAKILGITADKLLVEDTAKLAKELPNRVDFL